MSDDTGFCRHSSPAEPEGCRCPDFELQPEDPNICETCEHRTEWHLPPLELSYDEGKRLKASGQPTLERCKEQVKLQDGTSWHCPCPVFKAVAGTKDCGLCGHKLGWHKWKDVAPSAPRPPRSPGAATSSSGSASYSSPISPHAPQNFAYPPPPQGFTSGGTTYQHQQPASHSGVYGTPPSPFQHHPGSPVAASPGQAYPPSTHFGHQHQSRQHAPLPPPPQPPQLVQQPRQYAQHPDPNEFEQVIGGPSGSSSSAGVTYDARPSGMIRSSSSISNLLSPSSPAQSHASGDSDERPPPRNKGKAVARSDDGSDNGYHTPPQTSDRRELQPIAIPGASSLARVETSKSTRNKGVAAPEDEFFNPSPIQQAATVEAALEHAAVQRPHEEVEYLDEQPEPVVAEPRGGRDRSHSGSSTGTGAAVVDVTLPGDVRERHGSVGAESVLSDRSAHLGNVDAAVAGQGAGAEPQRTPSDPTPGPPRWKEYESKSKNLTLSVSPPIESKRFKPGQVFHLKLSLGQKVSLSSFDKVEVSLIGLVYVHNEPPDSVILFQSVVASSAHDVPPSKHNFLSVTVPIHPNSDVHTVYPDRGQRVFAFDIKLPFDQTCDCRQGYGHHVFRIDYHFKVTAKKHARFGLGSTEKFDVHFAVDAPYIEVPGLVPTHSTASVVPGTDGPWKTVSSTKANKIDDQMTPIINTELAYQIIHPPDTGTVQVPYRLSLNFGAVGDSVYFNEDALKKFSDQLRISLSRRVVISKSGKTGGEERALPTLLVTFKDKRERSGFVNVDGRRVWRVEGVIEADKRETRSLSTCSVTVRYLLSAKALASCGFSNPIELYARNVNVELPTHAPEMARQDSTGSVAPSVASGATGGTNGGGGGGGHRQRRSSNLEPLTPIASGSGLNRAATIAAAPAPTPAPHPSAALHLNQPPPPPQRGVQLQDGVRPPSIAGSSFFRLPPDQRETFGGAAPSSEGGWSVETPTSGPASLASHGSSDPPELLPTTANASPAASGSGANGGERRLELPPDFDEEFPHDLEPTPAYEPYDVSALD
ncbi:hypothetical protein MNV49_005395 [Pseudohyphozyma bogoriensis]|nr:hypothetical protein MNV49_005395 [Pseudohyphozyma bogoriensis]